MRAVRRSEVLDYESYGDIREQSRKKAIEAKALRRVQLGSYLSLCFENTETTRHQIQEMIWMERLVRELSIQALLAQFNSLLGTSGDLSATLFVEIEDRSLCQLLLGLHKQVASHVYLEMADGSRCYAVLSEEAMADERPAATQFVRFEVAGRCPRALGCELEDFAARCELPSSLVEALCLDLS